MWGIVDIKTHLIVMTLSTVLTAMAHKTTQMMTFIETLMTATSNMNETNMTANLMANMITSWMTSRMNIKNQTTNKMNMMNSIRGRICKQVMMRITMMMT
jgi:beta-mannanase